MRPVSLLAVATIAALARPTMAACQSPAVPLAPPDFWRARRAADSIAGLPDPAPADSLYRRLASLDTTDVQLWLSLATTDLALRRPAAAESAFIHVYSGRYFQGATAVQVARLEAEQGHANAALAWLDSALAHRYATRALFQRDTAFAAYRNDPRFRRIAGMLPARTFSRVAGWRYDLAFFAAEARRLHVGFARPAFAPVFSAAVADLNRRIPRMSDDGILAGLQHLATLLDDGHSGVYLRNLPRKKKRLPVDFYWFADGMYVVGARQDHRDLIGSHVVRLGSLTPSQLPVALEPYVPRDNPMRILALGIPFQLDYPFQLQALGAISDTTEVPIAVADSAGQVRELKLEADDARLPQARLAPRDSGDANPLWLRHPTTNIWMAPLRDVAAVYVQYNACADAPSPGETVAAFSERLAAALKDTTVRNVIVDVRRNGGGNLFLNLPLQRVLFAFAQTAPTHRIWVLAGRFTFSAAQSFVNYIERFTNAIFVGEPTGSSPNFTGENAEVVLPYSGIAADISNENHYSAFWEDQRPWIAPTIPVAMTAADYFSNRDPVLDAVLGIIRRGS